MPTPKIDPSVVPIAVTSPEDAFRELWSVAVRKHEQGVAGDSHQWRLLHCRMDRCSNAEDVCLVLDETMQRFEGFRGSTTAWGKLRNKYLKPAVEVLLLFNDAIVETASQFSGVPGGKAIFGAFGILLQATRGVSAYFEALTVLFEELNFFLESLRPRLHSSSSLGPASKTIAITILAHLLDVFVHVTRLLSKRPWLGRLASYGCVLTKDTTIVEALQRLRLLTALEVRAIAVETQAMASETRHIATKNQEVALEAVSIAAENRNVTKQILDELRSMNQGRDQAVASRTLLGRGVDKLLKGQKEFMEFLRAEKKHRENIGTLNVLEKLTRIEAADINAQSPEGCMKGTRVEILKDLRAWSRDPIAPRIYWLNGMAGTGKSAIARSFSRALHQSKLLGGSFFCSRGGSVEEGDARRIIPTLAASMAICNATFQQALLSPLQREPFSIYWNFELQIERLLQSPLAHINDSFPTLVFVIDALDECSNETATRDLITRLVQISANLPLKFFLTSRPEPHVREQLESLDPALGQVLRLHDIEEDIVQADITLYLSHGLRSMRQASFPDKWPSKSDVTTLARLSGKLFIYAFTALQYVRKNPIARLVKLTGTIITAGRPMTKPLDTIYSLILSEAMDPDENEDEEIELTRSIIAIIVNVRDPLSVLALGGLLGMSPYRIRNALDRLYAVIYVPLHDDRGVLSTFHASFGDFLTTPERAPEYMMDQLSRAPEVLALSSIDILRSDRLHFNVSMATSSHLLNTEQKLADIEDPLRYACLHGLNHAASVYNDTHLGVVIERLLMGPKFLFWLEAMSTMGHLEKAGDILESLYAAVLKHSASSQLTLFLFDALKFVRMFYPAISKSAPHIYVSALALSAPSAITQYCSSSFPYLISARILSVVNKQRLLHSAAFSPNGRHIVAASHATVFIFDAVKGSMIRQFSFGSRMVQGVAYSRNGREILASSSDKTTYVWSTETGSLLSRAVGTGTGMTCVAFSPTTGRVAMGLLDHSIELRDTMHHSARTAQRVLTMNGHSGEIRSLAFSRDGSLLASGSADRTIRVWNTLTGEQVCLPLEGHKNSVLSVTFAPAGTYLVSGSADRTVRIWDIEWEHNTVACVLGTYKLYKGHADYVVSVACSPDSQYIVSGSSDTTLRIFMAHSGELAMEPIQTGWATRSVAFSPDGNYVLSTSEVGAIRVHDIRPKHSHGELPDIVGKQECIVRVSKDGWIRGLRNELLLWLSEDQAKYFHDGPLDCALTITSDPIMSGTGTMLAIDWTASALGSDWTSCYIPADC